ncbi:MAG: helix-hairpin-helix domain-containing protein [Planctomycetota bacterium]
MTEQKRRLPWLTAGDRLVLVVLLAVLIALLGADYLMRAGVASPDVVLRSGPAVRSHEVDVNSAPWWELQAVRGLGEIKARAIVEHRKHHGLFDSLDELVRVSGIGRKTLERLKPYLAAKRPAQTDEERE